MTLERKNARIGDEALDILLESKQAKQRFHDNYDQWMAVYPDQWVAVSKNGLVAHHESLAGVIEGFREKGYANTQVVVKRLDAEPRAFLL